MIEIKQDALFFSFPEVHHKVHLRIGFQRTLRIPDDDRDYPLPPGLGRFPLRHVDDFAKEVPELWLRHGGVMLPMYQSEALWLNFDCRDGTYPFAIKIATGKINAVSGGSWEENLNRRPQDYVVAPKQPWLDGYCVEKGVIRQFVAMPLGSGYSAKQYTEAGLPWFEYYGADAEAVEGSKVLGTLESVLEFGQTKKDVPLPENESVEPGKVIRLREGLSKDQVREGSF